MNKSTCKLYRNVHDILHPSISRKNISQYKIILKDKIPTVSVFYPEIDAKLDKVAIYIHGDEVLPNFYEEFAARTGMIVLLINYSGNNVFEDSAKVGKYLYDELNKCGIDNVILIGDFTGSDVILELSEKTDDLWYKDIRKILLSPTVVDLSKYNINNALVLSNNEEQISSKNMNYHLVKESVYDLTHDMFTVTNEKLYKYINKFVG